MKHVLSENRQEPQSETSPAGICLHCQQPTLAGEDFCCSGCQAVYQLLQQTGLSDYYQLRERLGTFEAPQPVKASTEAYDWLDQPDIQVVYHPTGQKSLRFYLDGVHCAACLWLIEKLPEQVAGVADARLNVSSRILELTLAPEAKFAPAVATLARWGYRPHLIDSDQDAKALSKREQFWMLSRIGVAAFSTGNLMILAVAIYSGLEGPLARYFEWLSLVLALPALSFSAWPFYQQAWSQVVHQRRISLDLPIAVSLVLGTLGGIHQLLSGQHQIYFDSLAMLVFLLLLSRYTLMRTQQNILRRDKFLTLYLPRLVARQLPNSPDPHFPEYLLTPLAQIGTGDIVKIEAEERIPVDGIVVAGQSRVDQAVLTGEPYPLTVKPGDEVLSGTFNQENPLLIQVTAAGQQSRLGEILANAELLNSEKSKVVKLTDKVAQRFIGVVLLVAAGILLMYASEPQTAFTRMLALVIVACPCALALATPLIVQISLKQALGKGFFIKEAASLEQLSLTRTLVFDKTGTLTQGCFEVLAAEGFSPDVRQAVWALESHSKHPVARALQRFCAPEAELCVPVDAFEVLPTGGIQGQVAGCHWQISPDRSFQPAADELAQVRLQIWRQAPGQTAQAVAWVLLGDALRPEAEAVIQQLQQQGYQLWLLSGDQATSCQRLAHKLGFKPQQVLAQQTPEAKAAFFKAHPEAVMLGDGMNDLLAFSTASVSISLQGSVEENLRSSDIYLAEGGLKALPALLQHAQLTRTILFKALGFSFVYNLLTLSAAASGFISPLMAAVLMPFSALSVYAIGILGGKQLCKF